MTSLSSMLGAMSLSSKASAPAQLRSAPQRASVPLRAPVVVAAAAEGAAEVRVRVGNRVGEALRACGGRSHHCNASQVAAVPEAKAFLRSQKGSAFKVRASPGAPATWNASGPKA